VGVFADYTTAQRVQRELVANGFRDSEIELQSRESYASDAASGNTGLSGRTYDSSGGGIGGFFRRLFGSDDYRDRYSSAIEHGHAVLVVNTNDDKQQDLAADIMNRNGAIDVDERASSWQADARHLRERNEHADRTIPVVREDVEVSKRMVQRGGVRIVSHLVEQPVEEQVRLREEHVRVDRVPADRPATDRDLDAADEVIEVTETAEEPVIRKRTKVVEEVKVSKQATERTETIKDKVRRTDVDVQKLGSEYDDDFRRDWRSRYSGGGDYDTYAPAYQYGYRMASDDRYRGRRWEDVESDLRTDYERSYPGSAWERVKDSIRYGWDRITH